MLNKGPYVVKAVEMLDAICQRTGARNRRGCESYARQTSSPGEIDGEASACSIEYAYGKQSGVADALNFSLSQADCNQLLYGWV